MQLVGRYLVFQTTDHAWKAAALDERWEAAGAHESDVAQAIVERERAKAAAPGG